MSAYIKLISVLIITVTILFISSGTAKADPDSWQDDFDTLDTDTWGTSTSGSGTANVSGGYLSANTSVVADAALAYIKDTVNTTISQLYLSKYVIADLADSTDARVELLAVFDTGGGEPVVSDNATVLLQYRISVSIVGGGAGTWSTSISYKDSTDTWKFWNGSSWVGGGASIETVSTLDHRYVYLETDSDRGWRVMVTNAADTRWIAITDWVTWANTKAPQTNMYVVTGEPMTDFWYGTVDTGMFEYYDELWGVNYFNGIGQYGGAYDDYRIFRANTYQSSFGSESIPWSGPVIEPSDYPVGESIDHTAWPYPVEYNGTLYIFATANDGASWDDIWYFTSTDDGDSITLPQNTPIISTSGGTWRTNYVGLPVVYRDTLEANSNKRWKMYITGGDATDTYTIGYFYAADPPVSGSWTWTEYSGNPVISPSGTPGAWDRYGVISNSITGGINGVYFYIAGIDNITPHHYKSGLYTSVDWTNFTSYGGNPIFSGNTTKRQDLTVNLNSGINSAQVADSSVFSVGEIVIIYDENANRLFDIDRINLIPDGTHITLEVGATRNYTTANDGAVIGLDYWSVYPGTISEDYRYMFSTHFQQIADGSFTLTGQTEISALLTSTDETDWTTSMAYTPVIPLSPASGYFYASAENLRSRLDTEVIYSTDDDEEEAATAPDYIIDCPTCTDNITSSGNFTSNETFTGGPPGFAVIDKAAENSGAPPIWLWGWVGMFSIMVPGFFITYMERKYGSGNGNLILRIMIALIVMGLLVTWQRFDWWMIILYLMVAIAPALMSRQYDWGGAGGVSQHGWIGFCATSWIGLTIINRILEGRFLTSSESSWWCSIQLFNEFKIFDMFTLPVINFQFFTVGIPSLLRWDYSCLLYTSPSPRDRQRSRMPSSA